MNNKNFILLGIFFCILICVSLYLRTIYNSWQSEILQMQTETTKLQTEEKILSGFSARNKNFDDFINLQEEKFLTVREFVPEDFEQEKFTDAIYRTAEKNNVSVIALQVAEPVAVEVDKNISGQFFRQSVRVQFESNYIDLLNFLREILDGERFATLSNISVEKVEDILDCEAEFFIYSANLQKN